MQLLVFYSSVIPSTDMHLRDSPATKPPDSDPTSSDPPPSAAQGSESSSSAPSSGIETSDLLSRCRAGDPSARERLIERVYPELKSLAGHRLSRSPQQPALQTTELVHETYLRLLSQRQVHWRDRAHFFAIAARLMRRALIDAARFQRRAKRGSGQPELPLAGITLAVAGLDVDALALEQALQRLGSVDSRALQVVELRYFAGLSFDEVAEALSIGRATAVRAWRFARSWLHLQLEAKPGVVTG